MPEEERDRALERAEKRLQRNAEKRGLSVTPEFYMAAEIGYYFGWEAIMALRRGYTTVPSTNTKGETVYRQEAFTTVEAHLLLEGARKVWYSKLVEQSGGNFVAYGAANSKNPVDAFNRGTKDFQTRAEVAK